MFNLALVSQLITDYIISERSNFPDNHKRTSKSKLEIITKNTIRKDVGGCVTNSAFWLQKMNIPFTLFGTIGDDSAGHYIEEELQRNNMNINISKKNNTGAIVTMYGKSSGCYYNYGDSNILNNDQINELSQFSHIYVSCFSLLERSNILSALESFKKDDKEIIVDGGGIQHLRQVDLEKLKGISKIIFLNDKEQKHIGDFSGITVIKNKKGRNFVKKGSIVLAVCDNNINATIINEIGAGDAYAAGFIREYLNGSEYSHCLLHAKEYATICLSKEEFH